MAEPSSAEQTSVCLDPATTTTTLENVTLELTDQELQGIEASDILDLLEESPASESETPPAKKLCLENSAGTSAQLTPPAQNFASIGSGGVLMNRKTMEKASDGKQFVKGFSGM